VEAISTFAHCAGFVVLVLEQRKVFEGGYLGYIENKEGKRTTKLWKVAQ
jgi:hypothetical protein